MDAAAERPSSPARHRLANKRALWSYPMLRVEQQRGVQVATGDEPAPGEQPSQVMRDDVDLPQRIGVAPGHAVLRDWRS